jgi:hypothetical protein
MNGKFRNINRVNFKLSARERDPVKWAQKKIAFLAGTGRKNSLATSKYKRKSRTAKKGTKKLPFKQHEQESTKLFIEGGQTTAGLELAPGARPRRDHANYRTPVPIR